MFDNLGEAMTEKIIAKAVQFGRTKEAAAISKLSKKRKAAIEKQGRQFTVFRSSIARLIPQVDMDKKIFLQELLKLLGHSDNYFKSRQYVAFYNSGLTFCFLCIQV